MENLLKLEGVKELSKEEQVNVNGGFLYVTIYCNDGYGTSFVRDADSGVDNISDLDITALCYNRGGYSGKWKVGEVF